MLHAMLFFAHILGIICAVSAMFVSENVIYRKFKNFSTSDFELVNELSNIIKLSVGMIWVSGLGLIYLGYQSNLLFLANEKIWAKIIIVALITLNGLYISKCIMPRIKTLNHTKTLVNSYFESFLFRLSFAISVTGWLVAMFYGIARFMNNNHSVYFLLLVFVGVVLLVVMASYIIRNVEFLRPNNEKVKYQENLKNHAVRR